ncbi:hypothetical protein [Acidisoma sp. C75]
MTADESVFNDEPPPRRGDVVFGSGGAPATEAYVHSIDNAMAYQDGYRRAALALVEQVCSNGRGQDFLVYPIVYLYRHHVELVMKSIVKTTHALMDHSATAEEQAILGRHNLMDLWKTARPLVNPVCALGGCADLPEADLEGIDWYISELHRYDCDGQRFRYATAKIRNRGGGVERSLPKDLVTIDLHQFATAMEKLADYLEGMDNWFGDLLEAKWQHKYARMPRIVTPESSSDPSRNLGA